MVSLTNNTASPLSLKPFDEKAEVRLYDHAFLPHLRQAGCTYFVTFRLADSVPKPVMKEWSESRLVWLRARGIDVNEQGWRGKIERLPENERQSYERAYAVKLFETLDKGFGENYLIDPAVAAIVEQSLLHFNRTRFDLGDYVIMPNHVHALMTPFDEYSLEDLLHSIKSFSSNQINRFLDRKGKLWMSESYDRLVRDSEELLRTQEYIRANPRKANLSAGQFLLGVVNYDPGKLRKGLRLEATTTKP